MNAIAIPDVVRELLDAPNYVHFTTLGKDGSPSNTVVWVWVEGDHVIVATSEQTPKARNMRQDPRVAMSVVDVENPYRMAALRGEVVAVREGEGLELMDRMARKYTGVPFPAREITLTYFVIAITSAYHRFLGGFEHNPASGSQAAS
jgi:PPOX class probable F420-dependent enzyme